MNGFTLGMNIKHKTIFFDANKLRSRLQHTYDRLCSTTMHNVVAIEVNFPGALSHLTNLQGEPAYVCETAREVQLMFPVFLPQQMHKKNIVKTLS